MINWATHGLPLSFLNNLGCQCPAPILGTFFCLARFDFLLNGPVMHRPQQQPVREGRLRAACDRCHDLKNRCVRVGGTDSRCDRCERLDIDCVYRNSSRMGRPKRQRKTSAFRSRQSGEPSPRRMPGAASDRIPEISMTVAGPRSVFDRDQVEADPISSESTTLIDSSPDAMSLLMSPKG